MQMHRQREVTVRIYIVHRSFSSESCRRHAKCAHIHPYCIYNTSCFAKFPRGRYCPFAAGTRRQACLVVRAVASNPALFSALLSLPTILPQPTYPQCAHTCFQSTAGQLALRAGAAG